MQRSDMFLRVAWSFIGEQGKGCFVPEWCLARCACAVFPACICALCQVCRGRRRTTTWVWRHTLIAAWLLFFGMSTIILIHVASLLCEHFSTVVPLNRGTFRMCDALWAPFHRVFRLPCCLVFICDWDTCPTVGFSTQFLFFVSLFISGTRRRFFLSLRKGSFVLERKKKGCSL
ncbi:hypothetical protein AMTR_s00034p00213320 [Amborella trichopoda]|uniref:Uncharacterized protein n=1 Tax=Amborella trichopoda TaxID=13333 RepID=W1PXR6_AMBTC|nr:hypothetical protein AMTR_s00034p00213320 [Amborella trichopoda]